MAELKLLPLTSLTSLVHRPIEDVFAMISNHENYQHWYPGAVSVTSEDETPHGTVGKTYTETLRMPGGRLQSIRIVTVKSQPPETFVTQGDFAPLLPQMSFQLARADERHTRITWMFHSRARSPLRRLIIALVFRPVLKRQAVAAMANLTRLLEAGEIRPPPAPASR